jgi:ASC-1-like (ASCH) protein
MLLFVKQKYFNALKDGSKTVEIRNKPCKRVPCDVVLMCGRERLVGKITDCKELNQNDYVEFRKQP